MLTLCLICNRSRNVTVCGDNACPCRGGPPYSSMRPVVLAGLEYRTARGPMVVAPCGRLVPVRTEPRLERVA